MDSCRPRSNQNAAKATEQENNSQFKLCIQQSIGVRRSDQHEILLYRNIRKRYIYLTSCLGQEAQMTILCLNRAANCPHLPHTVQASHCPLMLHIN